ncbi:MAG: hypothetical protein P8Z75_12705 [Gammaproteobacteria bacterium]
MTRLKHYHLGCGEPLQSHHSELLLVVRTACTERPKPRISDLHKSKPGKRH